MLSWNDDERENNPAAHHSSSQSTNGKIPTHTTTTRYPAPPFHRVEPPSTPLAALNHALVSQGSQPNTNNTSHTLRDEGDRGGALVMAR